MEEEIKKPNFQCRDGVMFQKTGYNDKKVFYNGKFIGIFHQVHGYPCSVRLDETIGIKSIGASTPSEAIEILIATATTNNLGLDLSGNIYPDESWILRVSCLSLRCDANPTSTPSIVAKIHVSSKLSNGDSSASKPAKSFIVDIDIKRSLFFCKGKVLPKYNNQDIMLEKIKNFLVNKGLNLRPFYDVETIF